MSPSKQTVPGCTVSPGASIHVGQVAPGWYLYKTT